MTNRSRGMRPSALSLAGFLCLFFTAAGARGEPPRTAAETSDYQATSTYAQVIAFCDELAKQSPRVRLDTLGASQEGRENGTFNESLYFNQIPENVAMDLKLIDELGGPMTYPHYPLGWAMAGNTPFKRYKQETHAGGITDPLIIQWPKMIKDKGGLRSQYHHMIDITPTVLELLSMRQPRTVNALLA